MNRNSASRICNKETGNGGEHRKLCQYVNLFDCEQNTVELHGSNTFGTMKISSRQGLFEPMRLIIAPGQEA